MKLTLLRDQADAAISADKLAAASLADAQNHKIETEGNVGTTRATFAHALQSVGGTVVDTQSSPPKVYVANPDGQGYSVAEVPSLDTETPDPND